MFQFKDITNPPSPRIVVRNIVIEFLNHIYMWYSNYCNQRKNKTINVMESENYKINITIKFSREKSSSRKTNYIMVSALGLTYHLQR